VIAAHQDGAVLRFDHIQEKPKVEDAKSNLINVSKYLFEARFWQYVAQSVESHAGGGEYQITDPLNAYVADDNMLQVVMARGQYLDSGTPERWLYANNFVAQNPITR
jgi:UTP-glucose-1-phosphate uridylyltransferase